MRVLSIVQSFCRQRAASAALPLPVARHGTPSEWLMRLARCRRRGRSRELQEPLKTEGKIKGSARCRPQSQSARGVGAARRLAACVPSQNVNPQGVSGDERKPFLASVVESRRNRCNGFA